MIETSYLNCLPTIDALISVGGISDRYKGTQFDIIPIPRPTTKRPTIKIGWLPAKTVCNMVPIILTIHAAKIPPFLPNQPQIIEALNEPTNSPTKIIDVKREESLDENDLDPSAEISVP